VIFPKHGGKKRKETVFGCVKCSKKNSVVSVRDHHAVIDVNIVEE
jgi:hypothetical protein